MANKQDTSHTDAPHRKAKLVPPRPLRNERASWQAPLPLRGDNGSRPIYERDFQRNAARARSGRFDYGWTRLSEGQGYEWERRPAYGWERPGPWWQRGYGGAPSYDDWKPQQERQETEAPTQGPYAGRGPKRYGRRDEFIYEDVCEALTRHPQVDASEIEVQVKEGVVTLTGTVENRGMKRLAEEAVDSVAGVKDVENRLRLGAAEPPG